MYDIVLIILFILYEGSKAAKSIEISHWQNLHIGEKKSTSWKVNKLFIHLWHLSLAVIQCWLQGHK